VSGWFAFQLGSLMMDRGRRSDTQVAGKNADRNSPEAPHLPQVPAANSAYPRPVDPIASLTADVDCHWRVVPRDGSSTGSPAATPPAGDADGGELLRVGDELVAGQQLDLARGLAEITFRSGARVVLNGPAHFTIGSPLGGKLQIGKLTARVPHDAHGFTVSTSAGKVVDMGTEFGVAVAADQTMEVEVFVGEVAVDASSADGRMPDSISPAPSSPLKLSAGHAARVVPGQPVAPIPLDPKRFVRGLGPREDKNVAQSAYADFVRSLKPAVWFRMEGQDSDRTLHDEMGGPDAKLFWDGPGNPFVAGRVGKGLWLRGPKLGDYGFLPNYSKAEQGALSVAAWIYVNSRPVTNFPLVCNWGDANGVGQFYFGLGRQAGGAGALIVYITQRDGTVVSVDEPAAHSAPLYEWQHVAFTTDGSTLRLYRQGREVNRLKHAGLLYPVRTPALGIGARPNDAGSAVSSDKPDYWDGKLDEITIFNQVLSADDILKLATAPPQ
jgi:hypothetical protein